VVKEAEAAERAPEPGAETPALDVPAAVTAGLLE
jgi:hypothetical protein